jgi:glycosyltransferase involved in cell wall biosynthesis
MRVLFFADSLVAGGQERRLLELIKYLKQQNDYIIALVITEDNIYYKYAKQLGITIEIIKRKGIKYDPMLFIKFCRYCQCFKPDIIHTWGKMTTFYAIPTKLFFRIPLVSNLIADSNRTFKRISLDFCFFAFDIFFADVILSNSIAGLQAYKINSGKAKVLPNGVQIERFRKNFDKKVEREKLKIDTDFMIVMVACFSISKDYDLFLDVAKEMGRSRDDVTFVGVGDGPEWKRIQLRIKDENINNVLLTGDQRKVEPIIAAADIGLLCTYSEGISNSIIEYMALGKPVITTDIIGGSKEIVMEGETGYCTNRRVGEIISLINLLLKNEELRVSMGEKGRERITSHFSLSRMGKNFEIVYKEALAQENKRKKRS